MFHIDVNKRRNIDVQRVSVSQLPGRCGISGEDDGKPIVGARLSACQYVRVSVHS